MSKGGVQLRVNMPGKSAEVGGVCLHNTLHAVSEPGTAGRLLRRNKNLDTIRARIL